MMSQENVRAFLKKVDTDDGLKGKMAKLEGEASAVCAEIVKIGAASGYEFTATEYFEVGKSLIKNSDELSDNDLEQVAGGGNFWVKPNVWQGNMDVGYDLLPGIGVSATIGFDGQVSNAKFNWKKE